MSAETRTTNRRKPLALRQIRYVFLWVALLAGMTIGVRHIFPGKESTGGSFDAFCPFGGIETLYAYLTTGHTLETLNLMTFAIWIGVLGVALIAGRAFCGWMCPLGAAQEILASWARRLAGGGRKILGKPSAARLPIRLPARADRWARYLKYLVLGAILLASVTAIYPPLHDFCPARAVFSFQLTTPLLWSVLLTFIVTSFLVERFWCKYLCPLGAGLAPFNQIAPLRIVTDPAQCNHCGRCDHSCAMDVSAVELHPRAVECIRCLDCLETCAHPDTMTLKLG